MWQWHGMGVWGWAMMLAFWVLVVPLASPLGTLSTVAAPAAPPEDETPPAA